MIRLQPMSTSTNEIGLTALPGSNLLGYLAALGTLRMLSNHQDSGTVSMRWVKTGTSFHPVLRVPFSSEPGLVVGKLRAALHGLADHFTIATEKDLKIPQKVFRAWATRAADEFLTRADGTGAGMLASFGCDAVVNDDGMIEDTAFRTMSGAGHQHFLEFMHVLAKETTPAQLHEALFGPWRYRDASPSMRWDAEDDRRYALRWREPSKDPVSTVRGANVLAAAALPFFPVVPVSNDAVATTGFSGRGSRGTFVTWPIWNGWLQQDTVVSLLNIRELQEQGASSGGNLAPYGVTAVYRSQRITLGKYRNFTPSTCL